MGLSGNELVYNGLSLGSFSGEIPRNGEYVQLVWEKQPTWFQVTSITWHIGFGTELRAFVYLTKREPPETST